MKVRDFLPMYGLFRNEYHDITLNNARCPLHEVLSVPSYELPDEAVRQINHFDQVALHDVLSHVFINPGMVIAILQNLLDAWVKQGGDTVRWLQFTYSGLTFYDRELKQIIESFLLKVFLLTLTDPGNYAIPEPGLPLPPGFRSACPEPPPRPAASGSGELTLPPLATLRDACNELSEYERIMSVLYHKGYCTVSGSWRDYTAAWKSCLVKLIKWLALQGYCKKARLTPAEIRAICVNTFNTEEISLSTIHHVHPAPDEFAHLFQEPGQLQCPPVTDPTH